jgi:hypothetical protein
MSTLFLDQIDGAIVRYTWTDHNDDISSIIFYNDTSVDLNHMIEFRTDTAKLFNISEDHSNLMNTNRIQTVAIPFDVNFKVRFHVWYRVQLFLQSSFK